MSPVAIASVLVISALCVVGVLALFAGGKRADRQAEEMFRKRR